MSVAKAQLIAALCPPLPQDIIDNLLREYLDIKQNFVLGHYAPSELNGGRFSECILRLVQHISNPPYTPFGTQLPDTNQIIRQAEGNVGIDESMRFYIPKLTRILLDVRNRRNVAHVYGDVDPNYSDSLFVSQVADWILVEIVRLFYRCSIDAARKTVATINQVHIPVVFNADGFLKVQDSSLKAKDMVLVLLYYKKPDSVPDTDLQKWIRYKNMTNFRNLVLQSLDKEALIHFEGGRCILTTKGVLYVERNLSLELKP